MRSVLCAILALLLLAAPLSALHCERCGPEGCALEAAPPPAEKSLKEGHCHTPSEPAPVPGDHLRRTTGNETAPMDCCVDAAEVPTQVAATASTADSNPVAFPILAPGTLASAVQGTERRPPAPPPRPQAPLYHLHAALLI